MFPRHLPISAALLCVAVLAACTGAPAAPEVAYTDPAASSSRPVGTFDRRALVMAFYRSRQLHEHIADLRRQQDAARARNDQAEVARLESIGAGLQELGHRQLEGDAPLDNIFQAIGQDNLAALAREAGVASITSAAPAHRPAVDVTHRLTALLPSVR